MSVRRLTDADKSQIVDLYRTPGETAATLAEQFGVSNTTIGRILKAGIPVKEYDLIVQQKRRGGDSTMASPAPIPEPSPAVAIQIEIPVAIPEVYVQAGLELPADEPPVDEFPEMTIGAEETPIRLVQGIEPVADQRRSRRRSSAPVTVSDPYNIQRYSEPNPEPDVQRYSEPVVSVIRKPEPEPIYYEEEILDEVPEFYPERTKKVIQVGIRSVDDTAKRSNDRPVRRSEAAYEPAYDEPVYDDDGFDDEDDLLPPVTEEIAAIMDEDFGDSDETDEIEDDLDDDEDIDDEETVNAAQELLSLQVASLMRVRPFEEADMPRTCYLVIDRAAELVVRPLGDFGDLGSLPEAQKTLTLPIFDNHRVAKRFATDRTQRVIKVPDSQIFYKTAYQLRSKGITHLFVDGQIYSL